MISSQSIWSRFGLSIQHKNNQHDIDYFLLIMELKGQTQNGNNSMDIEMEGNIKKEKCYRPYYFVVL